ncbi:hypothetical protein AA0121_g4055 [Alternaria tenuissima]|nr:hypothetical protein AA0115_g5088 [Alternaria tenuissima]RYO20167.1 hypothetical protein AA0121_g4055 [Alternaria tenuissima]
MADRPITTAAPRLMALPGELRNRIYKAITDDEGPKEIRLYRVHPVGQCLYYRHPNRRDLGLAQTNRMFRSEFMSFYLTVRRPLVVMEDVPKYLEVFPLPDPALTASITTVLVDLFHVFEAKIPTLAIDILPLLRTDWSMFTFSMFAYKIPLRWREVTREFPLLLLKNSYHDLALYGGSWEETITAIYLFRQCPMEFYHSCKDHDEHWIELQLSAEVDAEASDFEKLRIFRNFVNRTQVGGGWCVEIRCISGRLSMSCVSRKAIIAKNLRTVKKACKVWSAKSRRYILAAKEETNKAARNVNV